MAKKKEPTVNKQKEIQILTSEVDAVRTLPDVYIGALGNHGFLNMFREILQNSLDEIMKGNTLDLNVIVSFDSRNKVVIIEDFGQGITLDKLIPVFTVLHSSSNYDKVEGSGDYSSGKNGMGGTITNFLSKFFIVESYRMDGTAKRAEFKEGVLVKEKDIKCPKGRHGLMVTFAPSDMMGEITINDKDLFDLMSMIIQLNKIGTRITYNSIDDLGQKHKTILENKIGLNALIGGICEKPLINTIHHVFDNGTMKIEFLFTYDIKNMDDPSILSFANTCPTEGGTHVDGFMDGVVKYFRDYMNKIYLANVKKKMTITAQDIRTGLRAVVSCFHIKGLFSGQSKERFSKEDMKPFAYKETIRGLEEWSKSNPADLQKVCKYLKEACEMRMKLEGEKVKITDKYVTSVTTGLPEKYVKPICKKGFEIIIVEGDSAKGGAVNNRDKNIQGLFPIRGKMPNAFTTPRAKYFSNEEVAGLLNIFGYKEKTIPKKFDPDKFLPDKVIIMSDADVDGDHIACLILGLFLRYLPFVIEQGRLYRAIPPLYGIKEGKKDIFFADQLAITEYIQKSFTAENKICNSNGKALSNKDITKLLYRNVNYTKLIDKISNTYAIDPFLLEFILNIRDNSFTTFKSKLKKRYKFINVEKKNDILIITGLVGSAYHTIFLDQRLLNDCNDIIKLINQSDTEYMVNGQIVSLYGLMCRYNDYEPKSLSRYKGLGEMDGKLLGLSTVLPGKGRTLRRYTIKDAKAELDYISSLQSDKTVFLKNITITKDDIL